MWAAWTKRVGAFFFLLLLLTLAAASQRRLLLSWRYPVCGLLVSLLWILYQVSPSDALRRALWAHEKSLFPSLSISAANANNGCCDYYLPIFRASGGGGAASSAALLLFFLDSGGGRLPETVSDAQIEWVRAVTASYGEAPSIAFMHIPSREFASADTQQSLCSGADDDNSDYFEGHHPTMAALAGTGVKAVFVGHNHGNSWCCAPPPATAAPALCYGRHTGYGGYGEWTRGARVIRLRCDDAPLGALSIDTWLRMEDGSTTTRMRLH